MRITIDTRLLGRGSYGGIQTYTAELARALLAAAPDVDFQFFHNGFRLHPLPDSLTASPNVSVVNWRIPNKLLNAGFALFGEPRLDRFFHSDVFFSPHFDLVATGSIPHVMTFHDLSFLHHPDFFSRRQRLWNMLQRYKAQAAHAAQLITDSTFTKSDLVQFLGVPEERITVIYPGIDERFRPLHPTDPQRETWRRARNIREPFLLYLGTLEPRKNILALLRAWELLRSRASFHNLQLVIAGAPGWLYRDVFTAIAASPYRYAIHLLGSVHPSEQVLLYNECAAFVYPSFFEGFGFPPLEAQACGAAVIVADRTSLPEVLHDGALFVDPWNVQELADAITQCLRDDAFVRVLRTHAINNSQRFRWQHTAQQTLTLLRHVATTHHH